MTSVCRTTADVFLSPDDYLASSGHSPFVGELIGAGRQWTERCGTREYLQLRDHL